MERCRDCSDFGQFSFVKICSANNKVIFNPDIILADCPKNYDLFEEPIKERKWPPDTEIYLYKL